MPEAQRATLLGAIEIRALADELDLRPSKQRGQNFVIDGNTVRRIVRDAGVGPDDVVLEVGPGLGSLTQNSDPRWDYASVKFLAYNSSKAAVNMITVQFAWELRETKIKVNAADPGYVATDMNSHQGVRSVEQGAATPVRLATLPDDGPTGGYFNDEGALPW